MHPVLVIGVVALGCLVGAALLWRRLGEQQARTDEVVPNHYESLLHAEPRNYPGLCAECNTANDPDYDFCRACGERLPDGSGTTYDRDLSQIFEPRD